MLIKKIVVGLTALAASFNINADILSTDVEIIRQYQSGTKFNAWAKNTTLSSKPEYVTVAIGWTTQCSDSYDATTEKSLTFHGMDFTIDKTQSFTPSAYIYWECGAPEVCFANYKGLAGVASSSAGLSVLGVGFNITMPGASASDTENQSTVMRLECSEECPIP